MQHPAQDVQESSGADVKLVEESRPDEKLDVEVSPDADVEVRPDADEKLDAESSPDVEVRPDVDEKLDVELSPDAARPHLQGVSIRTLPLVDLETENAAHDSPPRSRVEETQPSGRVPRHGENCGCQECQIETTDGKVVDFEHEAESELEREGNCAHSLLLRPGGMIFNACKNESANVAHEDTMIAEGIFLTEEEDELDAVVRVADDDPSDGGARDDDDVDHGCCRLWRRSVVALPNDCSGHELENSSQDEIVPEEFGNKPEVVLSHSVSTCPSMAAGLERDETDEWNEQSDDKQDACHDLEDTGIEMESEESNLPIERAEGPGEERIGIGNMRKSWQCSRKRPSSEVKESHHGPYGRAQH